MRTSTFVALWFGSSVFGLPLVAQAATRSYPGAAPCNTTLQACINGATAGDRIEITTANQIAEDLTIKKSITLTSAANVNGSIGGELTPPDQNMPHQIVIQEDPGGAATAVVISELAVTADVQLSFASGSGHSFALQHCELVRSSGGPQGDLSLTFFAQLNVPSNLEISDNLFNASDTSVFVQTDAKGTDAIVLDILRNRFLGLPVNPESSSAIRFELDTGNITAHIWSNLIHRQSFGAPGWGFTASHFDELGTAVSGVLDITGNTIDLDNGSSSYGMSVGGLDKFQFNLYDNIFSHMPIFGGEGQPMDARNNDFFAIDFFDPTQIANQAFESFVDPGYVDRDNGDFRLESTSQLVNAGFNAAPGGLPATDIAGNPRVVGSAVDIGAFEYAPPSGGAGAAGSGGSSGTAGAATAGSGGIGGVGGAGGHGGTGGTAGGGIGGFGGGGGFTAGGSAGTANGGSGGASSGGSSAGGASTAGTSNGGMSTDGGAVATAGTTSASGGRADGAGTTGAGASGSANVAGESSAGTGGAATSGSSSDSGSCAIQTRNSSPSGAWLAAAFAALGLARRRRRRRSPRA
ncbi:MAG TPA: choice-of-anchor Q domain-containing protein [Polyangiaceae bacterium]|jgi:MYXO-CTERM domain-containing protein